MIRETPEVEINQSGFAIYVLGVAPCQVTVTTRNVICLVVQQKLNGTESQRTPDQVSCDSSLLDTSGFFGVRETWVRPLEISWKNPM